MAVPERTAPDTESTRLRMSYEEFLEWSDENTHAEWVDGEVIVFMPPKKIHQTLTGFLHVLLLHFVRLFQLGHVQIAPFEVKIAPDAAAREPDLFFVATEHLDRLSEDRLTGPPDLAVEVISQDSVRRDRQEKFREYRDVGVREYWIIDPRPGKLRADFFVLTDEGEYDLFATEDDARVESHVLPGFWLRPEWLWQAAEMDPLRVFFEMRGVPLDQVEQIQTMLRRGPEDEETTETQT